MSAGWLILLLLTLVLTASVVLAHLTGYDGMDDCPHCGHTYGFEMPHDNTACEVAKLRREVAALRADLASGESMNP